MAQKVVIKKTLGKKDRWIHGELLIKRWGFSRVLLETSVDQCLPDFDGKNESFISKDRIPGSVGLYNCTDSSGYYHWHLRNPNSLARPRKPIDGQILAMGK
jgi:hypothetical protein